MITDTQKTVRISARWRHSPYRSRHHFRALQGLPTDGRRVHRDRLAVTNRTAHGPEVHEPGQRETVRRLPLDACRKAGCGVVINPWGDVVT